MGPEGYQGLPPSADRKTSRGGINERSKPVLLRFFSSSFFISISSFPASNSSLLDIKHYLASFPSYRTCFQRPVPCLPSAFTLRSASRHLIAVCFKPTLSIIYAPPNLTMPPAQTLHRTTPSLPLTMPGKSSYYAPPAYPAPYKSIAVSPPQPGSSVNTSAVPSLTSGSYAGSDHDSSNAGASGIDLVEMLNDRLSIAVDPLPLDRTLARQAQT